MDLNLLEVLRVVLAEQHVARAAARLHVTPSAVSNALARLRDQLGDPLVVKQGRGIVPTPRAEALRPLLERSLAELQQALLPDAFDPRACDRTFTLALADVGQLAWGPAIAKAFARELPRAHLRLIGIDALLALGDLGTPEVDLQIGLPPQGAGLHVEPLVEIASVLVGRPRRMKLADRAHVRVDLVPHRRFPDPFAKLYPARRVAMTVPSFAAAAAIVAATDYVTMLPRPLVGRLAVLHDPKFSIGFALAWHERTHADPSNAFFRALVRRIVSNR